MSAWTPFKRSWIVAIVLLLAFVVVAGMPSTAEALVDGCRGDPIVVLSNGVTVRMSVQVSTSAANVKEVVYTLHAPAGTSIKSITYTGGPLKDKERVVFHADAKPGTYSTDTVVHAKAGRAAVSATTSVGAVSETVSGYTGQHLRVTLNWAK
ncbi:MAG: hypothetical protein A2Z03_09585 [Chloroflexi bacterium RBG_16_56_8]|nr:MAG: hypothetical protein A2Z03_09585 [Chloroflexi bacterium RBG_16_56_8]